MTINSTSLASICGDVRWPETRVCSGHGDCIILDNIYQCVCDIGWSGHGDALNRIGYDCNVHRHTITIIHWIGLIYGIILWLYLLLSLNRLRHRAIPRVTPTATLQNAHQMLLQAAAEAATAAAKKRSDQAAAAKAAESADLTYMGAGGAHLMLLQAAAEAKAAAQAKRRAAQQKAEEEAAQRRRDRCKLCTDWDAPQRAVLVAILFATMDMVYFSIRLSNSDYIIATSPSIAALGMIGSTLFFSFAAAFLWIVVQSVITPMKLNPVHARQVRFLTRLMKWSLFAVPAITFGGMFAMCFLPHVSSMHDQEIIITVAMASMSASCLIILISIRIFGARLIAIIEHSMSLLQRHNTQAHAMPRGAVPTKDKRLGAGRARIVILVRAWTALGIIGGGTFLATAAWPWLRTQTAYVLPATWLFAGVSITFGTLIFTRAGASVTPSAESEHDHYAQHIVENNRRALAADGTNGNGGLVSGRVSVIGLTTAEHTPMDGTSSPGGGLSQHATDAHHPFHSMRSTVARAQTIGWSTACQPLDHPLSPATANGTTGTTALVVATAASTVVGSPALDSTSVDAIHITSPVMVLSSSHASHVTIAVSAPPAVPPAAVATATNGTEGASSSPRGGASVVHASTSITMATTIITPSLPTNNDGVLVIPSSPVHVDIDHMDAPANEAETISNAQAPSTPPSATSVYVAVAIAPFPISHSDERGVAVTIAMSSES